MMLTELYSRQNNSGWLQQRQSAWISFQCERAIEQLERLVNPGFPDGDGRLKRKVGVAGYEQPDK